MRKRIKTTTTLVYLLLIGFISMGWVGSGLADQHQQSTLDKALKRGVLRVGMSTFVPWAMKDKKGNLIGFEIDVASRLAQDMGIKVEFVPTKWSGIIPALATGKFDVIIGGMGILPSRNLKVNFSVPYDHTGMSMVAHKEKAAGFNELEDFNNSDVIIAARLGSTAVTATKKYLPQAKIRMFDDESQAYQELVNGRVHAVVGSAPAQLFVIDYVAGKVLDHWVIDRKDVRSSVFGIAW